ncbi:LCP family protein [Patescibacteria group bacterium]|nr:LCP family protein [Patescibacteria group bacterium]
MQQETRVDFLKKKYNMAPDRQIKQKTKKRLKYVIGSFVFVCMIGIASSYFLAHSGQQNTSGGSGFSLFSSFKGLVSAKDKALTGEDDDKINFLLLGIGGDGHDGPELTDTIIFSSFKPSTNEIGMMSIPRDLIVPIPEYGYRKINSINAYGEIENAGQGAEFSSQIISEILDEEIHYYVKADFDGFEQLIDAIGGIDVYVENSFTDTSYPTEDDLVQTISFQSGWQHMNGETALMFSRSRHGTNGEGSDFARAKRQQNILLAVKDKILSPAILLSPGKLNKLASLFKDTVQTNMGIWEILRLAQYVPNIDTKNISLTVLDDSPESPLYSSNINGAYVLLPKEDDWSEIQALAHGIFSGEEASVQNNQPEEVARNIKIEIQNGTNVSGLAFDTSQMLAGTGFEVVQIGNADSKGYDKTIIYDLSQGEYADELAILKNFLEADVEMSASGWIFADEVVPRELSVTTPGEEHDPSEAVDFLVILGANAENLVMR